MSDQPSGIAGEPRPDQPAGPLRNRQVQVGLLVLLAIGIGVAAWAWAGKDGDSAAPATTTATPSVEQVGPLRLSEQGLKTITAEIPQPIYWMGSKPDTMYELTRLTDGKVYVRYLPKGVNVNERQGELTIVATYAFDDAFEALTATDGEHLDVPGGGVALVAPENARSIHVAFPGVDYQVEIYDPSPGRAQEIALSGDVGPVE